MQKLLDFTYIFKQKLFKNTFIYLTTNIVRLSIPFFLLPVLTHYLSPSDYGIIATFQILLPIFVVFIGLQTHAAVSVNFFQLNEEKIKTYTTNVLFLIFINFILTLGIIYFLKKPISYLIKFPDNWLIIGVITAFSRVVITLSLTIWQVEKKPLPYGLFQIFQAFVDVAITLFFVIILYWYWQGRLLGIFITSVFFAQIAFFIIYKKKYINFSFNKKYIKDALLFGIPLVPAALGRWIMTGIDRIFINSMVSVTATGLYSVGYQVGMILYVFAASFNKAWFPFLFEKLKEDNYSTKVKIVKFSYLYFVTMILSALALSFIAPLFFKYFIGESFYSSYKYVFWIALSYAANGMFLMVVNYIYYVKKNYILAWITFSSAGLNIVLNYFLIKANGAIGAAQATTITSFVSFICTWILSAKVYKMPWLAVIKSSITSIK